MSQDSHFRDQASRHEATEESPLLIDTAYRSERSSVYGGESAQLINSPWKVQVAILLLLYLAEPITATVIYPFLPHLIKEFNIVKGNDARVGYYSGAVESIFYITEAFAVLQWGRVSDAIGRKFVLLCGSLGLALAMTCFGLSKTFLALLVSRALQGLLNGNTGTIKTMLAELSGDNELMMAKSFALMPVIWAVGSTLGPFLGGALSHPHERFPSVFSASLWEKFPYLLPCVSVALFSVLGFTFNMMFLEETIPLKSRSTRQTLPHSASDTESLYSSRTPSPSPSRTSLSSSTDVSRRSQSAKARILTPRLLIVLLNYAIFALLDISFYALETLFLSTSVASGGLNLPPSTIGIIFGVSGVFHGIFQVTLFPKLYAWFERRKLYGVAVACFIPLYALMPVMNAITRTDGRMTVAVWALLVVQLLLCTASYIAFSCMYVFITLASPSPEQLGATNGLAQAVFSFIGAIGPAGATSLFALSIEHNVLGGILVYVVMGALGVLAIVLAALLPYDDSRSV